MSDIFQEIEEDIKRERLDKLWEQHGTTIIIVAVSFVAIVAGYLWWGEATERRNAAISDEYIAANELLAAGDEEAGMAALEEIIANRAGGYVILASMQKAAKLASDGQTDEAVRIYDQVRSSNKDGDVLGELAAIKAGWLLVETADFASMQNRLGTIANAEEEGPWAASAIEILAWSAVRAERYEEAETLYLKLRSMQSTTMGIIGRTSEMLAIIQPKIVRTEPPVTPTVEAESPTQTITADEEPAATPDGE